MSGRLRRHARWLFYSLCRHASGIAVTCLTGVRLFDVPDLRESGGVILASNHQSFLDPVLVGVPIDCPVHFLARSSLFRPPGFGQLIGLLGAHPLRRGRVDSRALRTAIEVLRREEPLLLFPEGTRSRDGSLGPMRSGVGSLAVRCGVPVIPVCIEGAFEAWPRGKLLPRPAPVAVRYGEPLWPGEKGGEELTRQVAQKITEMQSFLRTVLGRTAGPGCSPSQAKEGDETEGPPAPGSAAVARTR